MMKLRHHLSRPSVFFQVLFCPCHPCTFFLWCTRRVVWVSLLMFPVVPTALYNLQIGLKFLKIQWWQAFLSHYLASLGQVLLRWQMVSLSALLVCVIPRAAPFSAIPTLLLQTVPEPCSAGPVVLYLLSEVILTGMMSRFWIEFWVSCRCMPAAHVPAPYPQITCWSVFFAPLLGAQIVDICHYVFTFSDFCEWHHILQLLLIFISGRAAV